MEHRHLFYALKFGAWCQSLWWPMSVVANLLVYRGGQVDSTWACSVSCYCWIACFSFSVPKVSARAALLMALASADHLCLEAGDGERQMQAPRQFILVLPCFTSHPAVLNSCSSLSIATSGPPSDADSEFLYFCYRSESVCFSGWPLTHTICMCQALFWAVG